MSSTACSPGGQLTGAVSHAIRAALAGGRTLDAVVMQDRNGARVEQVVLNGQPRLRVTDRYGHHVGYYLTVEQLAQVVDVPSLVEVHP